MQWRARLIEALKTMNSSIEGEKTIKLGNLSGSMTISPEESLSNKAYINFFDFISKSFDAYVSGFFDSAETFAGR